MTTTRPPENASTTRGTSDVSEPKLGIVPPGAIDVRTDARDRRAADRNGDVPGAGAGARDDERAVGGRVGRLGP